MLISPNFEWIQFNLKMNIREFSQYNSSRATQFRYSNKKPLTENTKCDELNAFCVELTHSQCLLLKKVGFSVLEADILCYLFN